MKQLHFTLFLEFLDALATDDIFSYYGVLWIAITRITALAGGGSKEQQYSLMPKQ